MHTRLKLALDMLISEELNLGREGVSTHALEAAERALNMWAEEQGEKGLNSASGL